MWHQSLTNLDEQGYGRVVGGMAWRVYIARLVCNDAVRGDSHATCHHSTTARAEYAPSSTCVYYGLRTTHNFIASGGCFVFCLTTHRSQSQSAEAGRARTSDRRRVTHRRRYAAGDLTRRAPHTKSSPEAEIETTRNTQHWVKQSSPRRAFPPSTPRHAKKPPDFRLTRIMQAFLFVTALAGASAALELNKASFDTDVKQSGKNAFVKFLAPW